MSSPPTLNGDYVVCAGVLPRPVAERGYRYVYHLYRVVESRVPMPEEILRLAAHGHTSSVNHPEYPRRERIQFS